MTYRTSSSLWSLKERAWCSWMHRLSAVRNEHLSPRLLWLSLHSASRKRRWWIWLCPKLIPNRGLQFHQLDCDLINLILGSKESYSDRIAGGLSMASWETIFWIVCVNSYFYCLNIYRCFIDLREWGSFIDTGLKSVIPQRSWWSKWWFLCSGTHWLTGFSLIWVAVETPESNGCAMITVGIIDIWSVT